MRRVVSRVLLASAVCLAPAASFAQTPPSTPATPPATTAATPADDTAGPLLRVVIPGELQLRYTALTTLPLETTPGRSDQAPNLGQNQYVEHWIRLRPELSIGEHFRVVAAFDLARAVVPDAPAQSVELAREPRTSLLPYGLFDLRQLFVEWRSPIGLVRVGQQAYQLGLGILANDGDQTPLFNDYRHGDLVERVALATRPGGANSDWVVAVAGDLVYRDRIVKLTDGDIALQGVASVFYQPHGCAAQCDRRRVGVTATYRDVSFANGTSLTAFVADLNARWHWPAPDHEGRVFAGFEAAMVLGSTDAARSLTAATQRIVQFGGAAEFGIERDGRYRLAIEAGWSSGDRNPLDEVQRQFVFNPSHRVGLLMFPEVLAWQSARSASIASDPSLAARAANGAALLPTQGAVAGAAYVNPTARVNLSRDVDLRAGAVIGVATTDVVDPVAVQLQGAARNYRGGDPSRRDLGVEFDLGVNARFPLPGNVALTGGVQGAVMLPGHAFDDAAGRAMPTQALATARLGLTF